MSDVFLSYKREDEARARALRDALVAESLSVWWDRETPGGESWRATIDAELEQAGCVIVLWSRQSVGPEGTFVRDEAGRAAARGALLPIRIDTVNPPLGFGEWQALDLVGWDGGRGDVRFQDVLAAVRAKIERRVPPPPRWPLVRRRRRAFAWLSGSAPAIVLAALVASPAALRGACALPGVRAVCRAVGLGHVPSAEEEREWTSALARVDGDGLRGYLARYPTGGFSEEARGRLAACRLVDEESWRPETKTLPQVVPLPAEASRDEESARQKALDQGKADARDTVCAGYTGSDGFRLVGASSRVKAWDCRRVPGGTSCGFDGQALCDVRVRVVTKREKCR
jgi:hypothetical protein